MNESSNLARLHAECQRVAHNAIHDAIYSIDDCEPVKAAVRDALDTIDLAQFAAAPGQLLAVDQLERVIVDQGARIVALELLLRAADNKLQAIRSYHGGAQATAIDKLREKIAAGLNPEAPDAAA